MFVYLKAQTLLLLDRIRRFDSRVMSFLVGLVLCLSIVLVHGDVVKQMLERSTSGGGGEEEASKAADELPPPGRAPDDIPEV